jgi:hypothetical protein
MPPRQVKHKNQEQVTPISKMDLDTFCLHMSVRHKDSLAGASMLYPRSIDEPTEAAYRAFHRRLHETRIDLQHHHEKGDPIQHWQDGE